MTAAVDIDEVVSHRGAVSSLQGQAAAHVPHRQLPVAFRLCTGESGRLLPSPEIEPRYHSAEEEIALGMPPAIFDGTHIMLIVVRWDDNLHLRCCRAGMLAVGLFAKERRLGLPPAPQRRR